jgi:hypothetical protein
VSSVVERFVLAMIQIYDTTLRDGTQRAGISLSAADKIRVACRLDELGFAFIEGGWPGSNPKDVEFFEAARGMTWQNARIAAFGSTRHRANRPDQDPNLAALVEARTPVITIFGKSWLLHVIEVLGASPAENLDMVAESVAFLRAAGKHADTPETLHHVEEPHLFLGGCGIQFHFSPDEHGDLLADHLGRDGYGSKANQVRCARPKTEAYELPVPVQQRPAVITHESVGPHRKFALYATHDVRLSHPVTHCRSMSASTQLLASANVSQPTMNSNP